MPLWRWVVATVGGLAISVPEGWVLDHLVAGSDVRWSFWLTLPIVMAPATLAALRVLARQVERANIATLDGH